MKKERNLFPCFCIVALLFLFFGHSYSVYATSVSTEDDLFARLSIITTLRQEYLISDNYEATDLRNRFPFPENYNIATVQCIDKENHIYYAEKMPSYSSRENTILSGVLQSPTARVLEVRDSVNSSDLLGLSPVKIDTSKAFYLPEDGQTDLNGATIADIITEGNLFTTSLNSINIIPSEAKVIEIDVEDKNQIITAKLLVDGNGTRDYQGDDNAYGNFGVPLSLNIDLYDGTNGRNQYLDEQYQFFHEMDNVNHIAGLDVEYSENYVTKLVTTAKMAEKDNYTLPTSIQSLKVRWERDYGEPKPGYAFAKDMGANGNNGSSQQQSYWYYQQQAYIVRINDGEWMQIDKGKLSPELVLQKGLNIIQFYGCSLDQLENYKRLELSWHVFPWDSYIFLVYKEDDSGYQAEKSSDIGIESISVYNATKKWKEAEDGFLQYPIYEKTNEATEEKERWIDLYSNSPIIWTRVIPKEQGTRVQIEGGQASFGGFYQELSPGEDNSIDIKLTPENSNEDTPSTKKIHINWIMSDSTLNFLSVKTGGRLTEPFSKNNTLYYLKKEPNSSQLVLEYVPSINTKVEVYVDRKLVSTNESSRRNEVILDKNVHSVKFTVITENGITKDCNIAISRDDFGINDETKQRAEEMVKKIINGGYISSKKESSSGVRGMYWDTYGLASLGESYLDGAYVYDLSKHSYRQATDYAAAILELVMTGENPYDFLGVDYVHGLLDIGPQYFGAYSNNIWALIALDAAGYPAPEALIKEVLREACDVTFDLDMRGWALVALSNHIDEEEYREEICKSLETIKDVQLIVPTEVNGYEVTGAFENFWYTNRNIQSHGCVISGLVAQGIDPGEDEFSADGLIGRVDGISLFESYQQDDGTFIRTPNELGDGSGFIKDAVIAVGDLYQGSNVWQRYALTNVRYATLLDTATELLAGDISDEEQKEELQDAYDVAKAYGSSEEGLNGHGEEFYRLQDAVYAINGEKPDTFQGTTGERARVREAVRIISELPDDKAVIYADRETVLAAEEGYKALNGEERLEHYVTNQGKLEKAYAYIRGIDAFLGAMRDIKKVDLSKAAKVKAAREAYDLLSDRQRAESAVAPKYEDLLEAEEIIEACRTADNVMAVIDTLGQVITLDSKEGIEGARTSYEALDEEQKPYVSNYGHLTKAEEELRRLEALEDQKSRAAEVDFKIQEIGEISHNSGAAIQAAEEAYQILDQEEERRMTGGYPKLLEARRIYDNLVLEEQRRYASSQADYYINRIEDAFMDGNEELTPENEAEVRAAVDAAREQYDAIIIGEDPEASLYVTGYDRLSHAEAMLQLYDWQQSGAAFTLQDFEDRALSIPASPGLESEGDILIAFAMYDVLSEAGLLDENSEGLYQELCDRREALAYLQGNYDRIRGLEEKILSLGVVGTGSGLDIQEASEMYSSMEPALQDLVDPSLIAILEQAADRFEALEEDKKETNRVEGLIESIREPNLNTEDKVLEARQAYEELEDKSGIPNYLALVNAEYRILELKKEEEDLPIATLVIERIRELKNIQLDDKYKVVSAREAYEVLTATQRKCVKNLGDLVAAEERIRVLETATVLLKCPKKKIGIGETVPVEAQTSVQGANVTWRVSDSTILSLNTETGEITGLKAGAVTLTVTLDNGNTDSCLLEVGRDVIPEKTDGTDRVTLNKKKVTLYTKGSGKTFTLTVEHKGKKVTGKQVKWKSSRPSTVRVSKSGELTAKKKGTAKIMAIYGGKTVYCKVTVKKPTLKLNKRKLSLLLKKKKTFIIKAVANGKGISGEKVKWSSSNKKVVTVSGKGKVIARKKGVAKITARVNGIKATVIIRVKE